MRYELESLERDARNRVAYYIIKDKESGRVAKAKRKHILDAIDSGENIKGIKLSKDRKVLTEKYLGMSDEMEKALVITGQNIVDYANEAAKYEARDNVKIITESILGNIGQRVILLCGIRRTGKTTAIQHTILDLIKRGESPHNIVYMQISDNEMDISELIKYLIPFKKKIIFIDEVTRVKNFISRVSTLPDYIAVNNKVILAGTDSYALTLAMRHKLYGRHKYTDFTKLTFPEYERMFSGEMKGLSNNEKIARFMLYGGVMSKEEYKNSDQTYVSIQAAMVQNIINTIQHNLGYTDIPDYAKEFIKQDKEISVYIIVKLILKVCEINRDISSKELNDKALNAVAYKFIRETTNKVRREINLGKLEDKNGAGRYSGITSEMMGNTNAILGDLRVIETIENELIRMDRDVDEALYKHYMYNLEQVCLLPSLLFCIATRMMKYLQRVNEYSVDDLDSRLKGILTENIVLSQCILNGYTTTFLRYDLTEKALKYFGETNATPEIDVIISKDYTKGITKTVLIEVKHSSIPKPEHAKNLRLKSVEHIVGKDTKKLVVYMGETTEVKGIPYVNIHDFLTNMKHWVEG